MRVVVLGGAGAMGKIIVRDLVEFFPEALTVIADYDAEKAAEMAAGLTGKNVTSAFADVADADRLAKVLYQSNVVINSTPYRWNLEAMEAALEVRAHYIDLGGLFHVTRKQLQLNDAFRSKRCLALIGMGAAPGISNLLAQSAAQEMETVSDIHIRLGSRDMTQYKSTPALPVSYSLATILEEFSMAPAVFTKGRFEIVEPMSGVESHKFPKPVGTQRPFHTLHSEVATLPLSFQDKGIQEVSFKIAFDPTFVERVRFLRDLGLASHAPITVRGQEVAPIEVINRIAMSQPPPIPKGALKQHEIVRAIVKGTRKGKRVTRIADCHTTGMPKWKLGTDINTGCPPSIAAKLIILKAIEASGVLPPERAVPLKPFFQELKRRRMIVKQSS